MDLDPPTINPDPPHWISYLAVFRTGREGTLSNAEVQGSTVTPHSLLRSIMEGSGGGGSQYEEKDTKCQDLEVQRLKNAFFFLSI